MTVKAKKGTEKARLLDVEENLKSYRNYLIKEVTDFLFSVDPNLSLRICDPEWELKFESSGENKNREHLVGMGSERMLERFLICYDKLPESGRENSQDFPLLKVFKSTLDMQMPQHELLVKKIKICNEAKKILDADEKVAPDVKKLGEITKMFTDEQNLKTLATRRDSKSDTLLKMLLTALGIITLLPAMKIPSIWETEGSKMVKKVKPILNPSPNKKHR